MVLQKKNKYAKKIYVLILEKTTVRGVPVVAEFIYDNYSNDSRVNSIYNSGRDL